LSVADNARDDVLLHVSASSKRQECGNETGLKKKRTQHQILNTFMSMGISGALLNTAPGNRNLTKLLNMHKLTSSRMWCPNIISKHKVILYHHHIKNTGWRIISK
jgi:hypothetical protein